MDDLSGLRELILPNIMGKYKYKDLSDRHHLYLLLIRDKIKESYIREELELKYNKHDLDYLITLLDNILDTYCYNEVYSHYLNNLKPIFIDILKIHSIKPEINFDDALYEMGYL